MLVSIIILIVALFAVVKGADWFLKSVEVVGKRLKLSAFLIGVILVGFGTSLPELATSLSSIFQDIHNVAIANIIGSNMANILLVLGLSTFFLGTIKFKKDLISLDLPYLFCVTVLFILLIFDGNLSLIDGIILLIGFVMYLLYSLSQNLPTNNQGLVSTIKSLLSSSKKTKPTGRKKKEVLGDGYQSNLWYATAVSVVSLIILALASRLAIESVLDIAAELKVSIEIVTFLTIALGTSLPEILVSFKALKQNKADLVLGNIIGSSIFNILLVGGVAAVVHEQVIDFSVLGLSIIGLFVATLILVINGITKSIHLWEGAILIMIYIALMVKIASV